MPFQKFTPEQIDLLARSITHYAFRSGPVEEMHVEGKLSQEDMKALNKYTVNRIAGLLVAAKNGHWAEIKRGLTFHGLCTHGWDAAEPDTEFDDVEALLKSEKDEDDL